MGKISATLALNDLMTGPLTHITNALNMTINSLESMQAAANSSFDGSNFNAARDEIAQANANVTQHKAVPKPDEVDMQQLSFFDTVRDDDIVRELEGLELTTMTPIDALNTLYRLQTKLRNRWKENG